jgi:uncharacterized membrane protein YbaN (DUF454 family)
MNSLYLPLAALFFALAVVGVFLPLVPTTPFVLLTSWCLVRSSPKLDARLRSSKLFGRLIDDWERERAVRPQVKRIALSGIALGTGFSLAFGGLSWPLVALLVALASYGAWFVGRLPTVREPTEPSAED